jgi:hypothetical protein
MDKPLDETALAMMMLALFTNHQIPERNRAELVKLWMAQLGRFTNLQVATAIQSCLDNSKVWPTISMVKDYLPGYETEKQLANKSWLRLLAGAEDDSDVDYNPNVGATPRMSKVSEQERNILELCGGIQRLVSVLQDPNAKEFMRRAYVAVFMISDHRFGIRQEIERAEAERKRIAALPPPRQLNPANNHKRDGLNWRCPKCGGNVMTVFWDTKHELYDCRCHKCFADYYITETDSATGAWKIVDDADAVMVQSPQA